MSWFLYRPPLLNNLRRKLLHQPLEKWVPQTLFLGIIFTGDDSAIANRGALAVEGQFLWELKDCIDRKWMAMYQVLPSMESMAQASNSSSNSHQNSDVAMGQLAQTIGPSALQMLAKQTMRCGGCGSKVGSQILSRVLKSIKQLIPSNKYVLAGVGDDCALITAPSEGSVLVQTVDYLKSFISDPYLFGQITALHALSDVYAMNGVAISALAVCVLPYGLESVVEETLIQVLAGACKVFAADCDPIHDQPGCALVGGHTSEGTELGLGFTINGISNPCKVLHKGSPFPPHGTFAGDVIILTKSLGTFSYFCCLFNNSQSVV